MKRILASLAILLAILVLLLATTYHDYAFVDQNTASRKGYRVRCGLWHTHDWYDPSPIEAYMRTHHPADLHQQWSCYEDHDRSLLFQSHACGQPGPVLSLTPALLADYHHRTSDPEMKHLYDILSRHDRLETQTLADHIFQTVLDPPPTFPSPRIDSNDSTPTPNLPQDSHAQSRIAPQRSPAPPLTSHHPHLSPRASASFL